MSWAFLCGTATYLQLQTEGNAEHLEPLHLKIHPYGCLVVLIKRTLTEPHRNKGTVTEREYQYQ